MIWLYRLLFLPVLILAAPYYLRRMRKRGGYGPNFSHRFGGTPPLPPKRPGVRRIWLQAVSVGEMLAVGPLLEALKKDDSVEVYLTTTTSTGPPARPRTVSAARHCPRLFPARLVAVQRPRLAAHPARPGDPHGGRALAGAHPAGGRAAACRC